MDAGVEFGTAKMYPFYATRWWLRMRKCNPITYADGSVGASNAFYVPFWALPFEVMHRAIFGSTQFLK